jgi:hypothetical protein
MYVQLFHRCSIVFAVKYFLGSCRKVVLYVLGRVSALLLKKFCLFSLFILHSLNTDISGCFERIFYQVCWLVFCILVPILHAWLVCVLCVYVFLFNK